MSEIILNKDNFEKEVYNSDQLVLIDFWAPWCGPCRMLSPVINELAEELKGQVKVCKVNVDDENQLAMDFNVSSIPTLVVMKGKDIITRSVGYKTKDAIKQMLK